MTAAFYAVYFLCWKYFVIKSKSVIAETCNSCTWMTEAEETMSSSLAWDPVSETKSKQNRDINYPSPLCQQTSFFSALCQDLLLLLFSQMLSIFHLTLIKYRSPPPSRENLKYIQIPSGKSYLQAYVTRCIRTQRYWRHRDKMASGQYSWSVHEA